MIRPSWEGINFKAVIITEFGYRGRLKSNAAIRIGGDTYEAVDVSHFKNGRTECVRPVSEESLAFVDTLLQEKPSREA